MNTKILAKMLNKGSQYNSAKLANNYKRDSIDNNSHSQHLRSHQPSGRAFLRVLMTAILIAKILMIKVVFILDLYLLTIEIFKTNHQFLK